MEYLDVVNEQNEIIGQVSREELNHEKHITRNIIVHIQDSDGKYIVCKRAPHKRVEPNLYDAAVCGFVQAGESYESAAQRELLEELGIQCDLNFLTTFYNEFEYGTQLVKHFTGVFSGKSDQEIILNDELVEYKKFSHSELISLVENNSEKFTKSFLKEFEPVRI